MNLFAPKYYKDFVCIADRCRHSCCIGWEIDIDERTMERYSSLSRYGKEIVKSIVLPEGDGEVPHFGLCEGERCPHLMERGLCRIITELGEGYLCDICREHPRFYNDTCLGREVGVGMACEEACRLILSSDAYGVLDVVGKVSGKCDGDGFDSLTLRQKVWEILSRGELSHRERLRVIEEEFGVSPNMLSDEEWRELLLELEYLNEEHRGMFSAYTSYEEPAEQWEKPLERALAYFVYRHCAEAEDVVDFQMRLGFGLFCERLLASLAEGAEDFESFSEMARIVSAELEYSEDNTEAIRMAFWI